MDELAERDEGDRGPQARASDGDVVARYERDASAVRDVARLRVVAAVVTSLGALWYLAIDRGWKGVALLVVVAIAARFWVRRASKGAADARESLVLTLTTEHVDRTTGDRHERLAWTSIERVEVDHDLLVVKLHLRDPNATPATPDGEPPAPWSIEPEFRGVPFDELADQLVSLHESAARHRGT